MTRTKRVVGAVAACVLLGACCMATTPRRPQVVDLQPLEAVVLPSDVSSIAGGFEDYQVRVSNGIDVRSERPRGEGIVEFLQTTRGLAAGEESVEVRILLFASEEQAATFQRSYCATLGGDGLTWQEGEALRSCYSDVVEARADPMGLCLPLGRHLSFVAIRQGQLLVLLREDGTDPDSSATNPAIADVAARLRPFSVTPAK